MEPHEHFAKRKTFDKEAFLDVSGDVPSQMMNWRQISKMLGRVSVVRAAQMCTRYLDQMMCIYQSISYRHTLMLRVHLLLIIGS